MEIGNNSFEKGLQTDASVITQPEGTYIDALNITLLNDNGEYYAMCNEKGTSEFINLPDGYILIGHTVVNENIIVFLKNPTSGFSQIGIINNNVYDKKIPETGEDDTLNFSLDYPVDAVGKVLFNGDISVYFTDNFNPIRSINLDDPPVDIVKTSKIVPDFDVPVITYSEILTGGNLTAGVYQFVTRYLDKELVPTTTSIPTQPIPIVPSREADNTDITKVFGGAFDETVNKSIEIDITNIDTDYPFLQLIAISYEGATSSPRVHIVNTYDVVNNSRTVVYSGTPEDAIELTVAQLQQEPITYDKAKAVSQKDNRVFYSNLTETRSKYRDELQTIANNISTTYSTSLQNKEFYANPLNCATRKTYKRGEVYSFSMAVLFKDGTLSFVYHIPGNDKISATNVAATGGTMGTYVSNEEYPLNQGYPAGKVRHHIMPTIEESNHFTGVQIQPLAVNFTMDNSFLPSQDLRDEIQGFVFFRERRDTPEKRSKLAQGFVTNIYMGGFDYESDNATDLDSDVVRRGDVVNSAFHFRKNVGFFNNKLNTYYDMEDYAAQSRSKTFYQHVIKGEGNKLSTHQGFYYSVRSLDRTFYDDRDNPTPADDGLSFTDALNYHQLNWTMVTDKFCFFSPETLLSEGAFLNPDEAVGANLTRRLHYNTNLNANTYKIDAEYDRANSIEHIRAAGSINLHYTVTAINQHYANATLPIRHSLTINTGQSLRLPSLNTFEFDNTYGGRMLYINTIGNHTQNTLTVGNVIDIDFARDPKTPFGNLSIFRDVGNPGVSGTPGDAGTNGSLEGSIDLYEIENPLTNQYGDITASNYVPIATFMNPNQTSFSNIQNGDIFITEYTAVNKDLYSRFFNFLNTVNVALFGQWNSKFFQENFKDNSDKRMYTRARVHNNLYSPQTVPGSIYGAAVTYFVESKINCYFRHTGENGIPYYPTSTIGEHWNTLPQLGENRNYNVQYSIENNIKSYFTRPSFDESISRYPNRTIYSELSREDDQVDYYKIIMQNSFYDLPEETGEIWDSFVYNNELFLHTPKSLWRTYVNSITHQATDIGEVIIGTGGLFSNESRRVLTSDGGYGGTISQFGNVVTPFGYFFVDLLQRKVFRLTDNLEEISLNGMQQFFDENLLVPRTPQAEFVDNTFGVDGLGIALGWDNEYKRVLLTQKAASADNSFTISYSPINKAWVSKHSYIANTYIEFDKFIYSIYTPDTTGSGIHLHNVGNFGRYYGNTPQPSEIEIVSNMHFPYEKSFDNFIVHSRSFTNNSFEEFDMFNTIRCYNDYQDSRTLNINVDNGFNPTVANNEVLCRFKKQHYQIATPRDNQEANLNTSTGWQSASRLKSKYLKTRWSYDNLNNREFIVNFIQYLYRIVYR